ncbi:hypothetical protein RN001_004309 [Aquatica leii]|uniref:Ionotropic glutamate receptor C-terminal domain-containing protein n=1 Tax=Aquatica leii TaxID=1421715 RepID=A0AAN7P567_9COLE|nr:hypothetical protein RN001_004309 [Aquatica leii]
MYSNYETFVIISVCFVTQMFCKLEPLPDELSSRLSLAQCVANVSKTFFGDGEILLVSLPVYEVSQTQASAIVLDRLLFMELFQVNHQSLVIKKTTNSRKDENYQKSVDNYVVQVRNVTELPENLKVLQGYPSWNPHAKFLIISVTIYEDNAISASYIVEQLWRQKISNGVILISNEKNRSIFDVYSWFPFKNGNCGDKFEKINIIDRCSYGKIDIGLDWFANKIPRKLNGCPIRVRTVIWPPFVLPHTKKVSNTSEEYIFEEGLEILLLNTMSEVANFSIIYTASDNLQDWGYIFANGTATGTLLYIKEEKADIAVSSFAASENTHLYFDIITYPIPESLKWCVPRADVIPVWKYFITILQLETFVCIMILFMLVSFLLWKFSFFQCKELNLYKRYSNVVQTVFGVMVNISTKSPPKSTAVRSIFLLWIFFSQLTSVYYQTFLVNVYSKPQFKKQIDTVDGIFENNLHLWFLPVDKRFFVNNNDRLSRKVIEKWNDCLNIDTCLHSTAFYKNSTTSIPRLSLRYLAKRYTDKNGQSLLYCFSNNIVTYPLEMILKKGFPFKEHFTNLVGWISDAGLLSHWGKQIFERTERKTSEDVKQEKEEHFTITIAHLIFPFVFLGVGYGLGLVMFMLELWVYKIKEQKHEGTSKKKILHKN